MMGLPIVWYVRFSLKLTLDPLSFSLPLNLSDIWEKLSKRATGMIPVDGAVVMVVEVVNCSTQVDVVVDV